MYKDEITIREIIREIYIKNKIFIYLYIGIVAIIVASTLPVEMHKTKDYTTAVSAMESDVVTEEQGASVGGNVYKGFMAAANATGASIEPISVLFVESVVALSGNFLDGKIDSLVEHMGVLQNEVVCYIIIILFVVLKLLRSNNFTKISGLVVEDVENKIGLIISATGPFITYFGANGDYAYAAEMQNNTLGQTVHGGLSILGAVMLSIILLAAYYVVRTIVYAAEIVLVPVSTIPLASGIIEVVKTVGAIIMVVFVLMAPVLSLLVYGVIFVGCLFLFKKAYVTVRYFKCIYIMPVFRKKNRPLVDVKKAEKYMGNSNIENETLFIPAFSHGRVNDKIGKYDKCWLNVRNGDVVLCKPKFMKRELSCYSLCQVAEDRFFINKNLRYIEIFALSDADFNTIHYNPLKVKKLFHFVISREHAERFEELSQVLQFRNYKEHQQQLKDRKKEEQYKQKLRRKQERGFFKMSAVEDKLNNIKR